MTKVWRVLCSAGLTPYTIGEGGESGGYEDRTVAEVYTIDDARMIAAAPDMLEALEAVVVTVPWVVDRKMPEYRRVRYEETLAMVKAAIAKAKAEGRS